MKSLALLAVLIVGVIAPYGHILDNSWAFVNTNGNDVLEKSEIEGLYGKIDLNNDHDITMTELTAVVLLSNPNVNPDYVKFLFKLFNADHNDVLNWNDIADFIKENDVNGDGLITRADFNAFWTNELKNSAHLHSDGADLGSTVIG